MAARKPKKVFSEEQTRNAFDALYAHALGRRPDGYYDNGGRWYPLESERCECCNHIAEPSRKWRWKLFKHCLSLKHLENLFGAEHECVLHLRRAAKAAGVGVSDPEQLKQFCSQKVREAQAAEIEASAACASKGSSHTAAKRL